MGLPLDGASALSGAASGAAAGTAVLPGIGTAAGAVIGLLPSLFKAFSGNSQLDAARRIKALDPGYQLNRGVLDNARILQDRYANYTLPGQTVAENNINNNFQNAYTQGVQGASSGGDVADLAAKLAYGKNVAEQNLEAQRAQGKESLLPQVTQANAAAGQEYQNKNAYERQRYEERLREKAGLTQAGATNTYNALDTGASVLSSYLNPKHTLTDFSNDNVGKAKPQSSIFSDPNPTYNTTNSYQQYLPYSQNIDYSKLYQRYQ